MVRSRKDLHFYLQEDMRRNGIKSKMDFLIKLVCGMEQAKAFRYIRVLRLCEYYHNTSKVCMGGVILVFWYRYRLMRLGSKYLIQIPLNTCEYGLRIMHLSGGGGIIINALHVGKYCGFNAGTLIGNKDSQDNRPTIGDHVGFGPGAKAFGKITIGNHVFVAANAVVTKNVEDNCIVGGVPAKVIGRNKDAE